MVGGSIGHGYRWLVQPLTLQKLFSDHVVAVDTRADDVDESLLWPEERNAIGDVVPGRWWDWVMGRRCARLALMALGVDPAPVLAGPKREPVWPDGVVGAITHTKGFVAAAVARPNDVRSIGVDAEPDLPLPDGVLRRISHPTERQWIESAADLGVAHADRLLFSAKESIYKAWFPLAGTWLGFEDAIVSVDSSGRRFRAEILVDGPFGTIEGSYTSDRGVIVTAIELDH